MINRRGFFEESLIAAGLAAATQVATPLATAETLARSTNETIGHAVIGCRIRGRVHAREFARLPNVEVTYVCDPDRKLVDELAEQL